MSLKGISVKSVEEKKWSAKEKKENKLIVRKQ